MEAARIKNPPTNVVWRRSEGGASAEDLFSKFYDSIGADEMPSLSKFKKILREGGKAWKELTLKKGYKEAIKNEDISPFIRYEDYLNAAENIDKRVVDMITSNGIEINGYKTHFINRMIGQYSESGYSLKGMRKGVPIEDVIEAITNPKKITDIKIDKDGLPSIKYIGRKCWVSVNPTTGELIQTNPRSGRYN